MSGLGAIRTASGGFGRHKVQTVVIAVVLLVSTASATLGFTLLATVNAPFARAFAADRGADATLTVNSARAGVERLTATRGVAGVTAAAGPFAEATVVLRFDGQSLGPRTLAGRASPGGQVDNVTLSEGHWPDGPGQVVLDAGPGGGPGYPGVGQKVTVSGAPGVRALTVTGFATSITKTADGWVTPAQAARLQVPGTPRAAQMLYRFASAGSDAQVHADVAAVARALPTGAVTGAGSWLTEERIAAGNGAIMEPFVVAFALIGLAMAVLIVGNVVSGAVIAQYHRIGVLKSIGLSPAQVVVTYLSRIGWPALAGCVTGVAAGALLAEPVLRDSSGIYGVGRQQFPWWAGAAALAGMLTLTALAAFGPALRAGRLPAVAAIAAGRAPRAGRGYLGHRLTAWLPLPRPVSIGLAAPLARPARTAVTLAAITFGACAVIFAIGLSNALNRAEQSQTLAASAPVRIVLDNPNAAPSAAQDAAVTAELRAEPGTGHEVAVYGGPGGGVKLSGVASDLSAEAFGGNASWLGYAMIAGRWYRAPGEVDVNTSFLTASGLTVGDTATVDILAPRGATAITVRIVGEVFEPSSNPWLLASTRTLHGLATRQDLQGYDVGLRAGTSAPVYLQAVNQALGRGNPWRAVRVPGSPFYEIATALISLLALMVAVAAALGVLNTVLMTTRDRVHDLGIFKAIGMRPSQLLTMVVCWIAGPAVVAAVIAAPAAVALTTATMHAMAGTVHTGLPASFTQVFGPARLALLSLGALAIALAGALLPAAWAARTRPATALRAE